MKLYLQGQEVFSFVDGSFRSPLSHIVSIYIWLPPQLILHFLSWKQHDHLIMSAFLSLLFFLLKSCSLLLIVNI